MTPKNDVRKTKFWKRWIYPRRKEILLTDWTLWTSLAVGVLLFAFPLMSPLHLIRGVTVELLGTSILSFAAIGLGISVALGALVVTFPSGKLRTAMQRVNQKNGRTAFADLAFVAFWAGLSNLLAASVALTVTIIAGPYKVLEDSNVVAAAASGLIVASALYALLQMLAALVALLEAAGLAEKFDGRHD